MFKKLDAPTGFNRLRDHGGRGRWVDRSLKGGGLAGPRPINTVAPALTGTTSVGQTLSTGQGTWSNTPTSYTYQWYSADPVTAGGDLVTYNSEPLYVNAGPIADATSSSYVLTNSELGLIVWCVVMAANANGGTSAASAASGPVTANSLTFAYQTGDRTASITVTPSAGLMGGGPSSAWVDGIGGVDGNAQTSVWFNAQSLSSSVYLDFDFGVGKVINEAKMYMTFAAAQGTWKWQGSNDGSSYEDIGGSVAVDALPVNTFTSLNANTTAYRHYRMTGVSGSSSPAPYVLEFEFKVGS